MANHYRRQIRELLSTALKGNTTVGSRVYTYRMEAKDRDRVPFIEIMTPIDLLDQGMGTIGNITKRHIDVVLKVTEISAGDLASKKFENRLDLIAGEIETVVFTDANLKIAFLNVDLLGSDLEPHDGLDKDAGTLTMNFDVLVEIDRTDPTKTLGS